MNRLGASLVVLLVVAVAGCSGGTEESRQESDPVDSSVAAGWRTDFSRHAVPLSEFKAGGPGKDGIPALTNPHFTRVEAAEFLRPREPVIELRVGNNWRAYPIQILIWHEIVNDVVAGIPVAVTFCPLCNTAVVFDRRAEGRTLTFGTTGNLRNSDLVMYDRQTESWWQQFGGEALVGRFTGAKLRPLPARIVSWSAFARAHPDGLVLTRKTGHSRPYGENPYVGYDDVSKPPIFPAARSGDRRLPPKERVVFVERSGSSVAVPFSLLARKRVVRIPLGGERVTIRAVGEVASPLERQGVAEGRSLPAVDVRDAHGRPLPFDAPFWFAVAAFRPDVVLVH